MRAALGPQNLDVRGLLKRTSYSRIVTNGLLFVAFGLHTFAAVRSISITGFVREDTWLFAGVWGWILLPLVIAVVASWKGFYAAASGWVVLTTIFDVVQYIGVVSSPRGGPDFTVILVPFLNVAIVGPIGAYIGVVSTRLLARMLPPSNPSLERP
jgi:hypothetical protein